MALAADLKSQGQTSASLKPLPFDSVLLPYRNRLKDDNGKCLNECYNELQSEYRQEEARQTESGGLMANKEC
jgi:hypothetical protein